MKKKYVKVLIMFLDSKNESVFIFRAEAINEYYLMMEASFAFYYRGLFGV